MKKKFIIKLIVAIIAVFLLAVILDNNGVTIPREINKIVPVEIYDNINGKKIGETTITINGTYFPHLFKTDGYFGEFSIPELPETEEETTKAEILFKKRKGYSEEPIIQHYGKIVYEDLGTYRIEINRDMDEIVWWTTVGTVATSYEAYKESIFFEE